MPWPKARVRRMRPSWNVSCANSSVRNGRLPHGRYQAFVQAFHASGGQSRSGRKRTSLNSVKVLKICTQVNEELNQRQKFVVLVHLLEFIHCRRRGG
jgi:hypothetical protein